VYGLVGGTVAWTNNMQCKDVIRKSISIVDPT
jgi:hypothetical protein